MWYYLVEKGGDKIVDKRTIEQIVDTAFDSCLKEAHQALDNELYPAAFANEYSWLRVKAAIDIQSKAINKAVKTALVNILDSTD